MAKRGGRSFRAWTRFYRDVLGRAWRTVIAVLAAVSLVSFVVQSTIRVGSSGNKHAYQLLVPFEVWLCLFAVVAVASAARLIHGFVVEKYADPDGPGRTASPIAEAPVAPTVTSVSSPPERSASAVAPPTVQRTLRFTDLDVQRLVDPSDQERVTGLRFSLRFQVIGTMPVDYVMENIDVTVNDVLGIVAIENPGPFLVAPSIPGQFRFELPIPAPREGSFAGTLAYTLRYGPADAPVCYEQYQELTFTNTSLDEKSSDTEWRFGRAHDIEAPPKPVAVKEPSASAATEPAAPLASLAASVNETLRRARLNVSGGWEAWHETGQTEIRLCVMRSAHARGRLTSCVVLNEDRRFERHVSLVGELAASVLDYDPGLDISEFSFKFPWDFAAQGAMNVLPLRKGLYEYVWYAQCGSDLLGSDIQEVARGSFTRR